MVILWACLGALLGATLVHRSHLQEANEPTRNLTPPSLDLVGLQQQRLNEGFRVKVNQIVERYDAPKRLARSVVIAAERNDLDFRVVASVAEQESDWRPGVVSHRGAIGLLQVKLSTARTINPHITAEDLYNPFLNADVGAAYLRHLVQMHGGDTSEALRSYNVGPTRARRYPTAGRSYSASVQRNVR